MQTHIPFPISYTYHCFLTETIVIERETPIGYAGRDHVASVTTNKVAGIYGFFSKEARDKFVTMCNNTNPYGNICYPCSAPSATEVVAFRGDQKAPQQPKRKQNG